MIKTLLVPLDGSALAERALPYAVHLVRAIGGRLLLLHATSDLALLTRMEAELDITVRLEPHLDALRRSGIDAASRTVSLLPAPAILSLARDEQVDLIVMSTHGQGGFGRWLYGSVADEVLRGADVPVLLVTPHCDRQWVDDRPFRILVPLDGSAHSEKALRSAQELAEARRAEMWLVRAIQEPASETHQFSVNDFPISVPSVEGDLNEAQQYLQALAARQGAAFASIDLLADIGEAAHVIADTARHADIDLIVMATHGRTGLELLTMGSVAAKVLQEAPAPVMLIRSETLPATSDEARQRVALG